MNNKNHQRVFKILPPNKRAFLLAEETLKIVIALISISFLIYFLTALYFSSIEGQKFRQADATMERIKDVVNNDLSVVESVTEITPSGWKLISYVGEKKPNSCAGQNCLCICEDIWLEFFDRQLNECSEEGICEIIPSLQDFGEIKIEGSSISIEIDKSKGVVEINKK